MKIFSQLEKAQLENTTSDTGSLPKGMITYRTDLNLPKVSNGTSMLALIDESSAQTLSGKTYASPVTTGAIQGAQIATPSNPSAGNNKVYFKSDGFLYTLDSSGNEAKVGSGSGGVKNLITNGSADDTASSIFVPYQDSSGTRPSDGTGGTTTGITTSVSSTTPLDGTKVFLLTKDASNRQGGGWAIPFDVPLAYRAKSMKISVQYIVNSGTFVAGSSTTESDVIWYLYDVTNSTLIEPSNIKMFSNSSTLSDVYEATFQTSATGSSYRLIAHIQSTSASAYELKVDNVTVSPQTYVYGTPKTNPASFTPTGTFTTNTTYTGKWFRDGHEMVLDVQLDFSGAPNSTTFSLNVPFGLSIDTSKFANTTAGIKVLHGSCAVIDTGVGTYALQARYASATTINLRMLDENGTAIRYGTDLTQAAPFTLGNTDQIVITGLRIPIVGWDSSTQMSDSADTRVVSTRAFLSTNQTGVNPNSSAVKINIDSTNAAGGGYDTHGAWASNRYNVKVPGQYQVNAHINIASTNVLNNRYEAVIYKNGAVHSFGFMTTQAATTSFNVSVSDIVNCKVDDYIEIYLYGEGNNSVSTLTAQGSSAGTYSYVSINKIQGPSAIAASETVAAHGYDTGSTIYNSNAARQQMPLDTALHDTHGIISGNVITIPAAGFYNIQGKALWSGANMSSGATYELLVTTGSVGGTIVAADDQRCAAAGAFVTNNVNMTRYFTAGTVLYAVLISSANHSVSTVTVDGTAAHWSYLSVTRV